VVAGEGIASAADLLAGTGAAETETSGANVSRPPRFRLFDTAEEGAAASR
jgi:hypothetical protein